MVVYEFFLKLEGTNEEYCYPLDLKPGEEDRPEQIFNREICQRLQTILQQKSLCSIQDHHLRQIVQAWLEDIREGYRETRLTLNLPLLIETQVDRLQEGGNQEPPSLFEPDLNEIEPQEGMFPPLSTLIS